MPKPYNGHRSWNAWNVALWLANDESMYRHVSSLVSRYGIGGAARRLSRQLAGEKTPDGARYNPTCIREALAGWR